MALNKSCVSCNLLEMNRKELTKINNDFSFCLFHSFYFFFRIPYKNVDVVMVLEKAEPESSVFSSNGGRYVYGVVPHGLPVFYPEPEGFRFIGAFQQEMYGREEEGALVCFDMFVGFSEVYECGDSEKRIVEPGKEFEMLPAVPMGNVDALFHGYE